MWPMRDTLEKRIKFCQEKNSKIAGQKIAEHGSRGVAPRGRSIPIYPMLAKRFAGPSAPEATRT
jgi:hypothetical protein